MLLLVAAGIGVNSAGRWWWRTHVDPGSLPSVPPLDLYAQIADVTPLVVTVASQQAPWHTTVDQLRRSIPLWRLMDLADWNEVPAMLREEILDRMLTTYRPVLMNPRVWDRMGAGDWDDVPQPVRTVAYRQMVAYWAGFYDVGEPQGLDRSEIRDTLAAIVMSESWFEHRAERIDFTGNRDIGLVQASDYARERLRQLAALGRVDVVLSDEDYWNPWHATRFLAIWMSLLLDEAAGDLPRAVGAYNRGIANAEDAAGRAYLDAVLRRRRRFIRNRDAPPAWAWLWQRSRQIEAEEWPWLHASSPAPHLAPPGSSRNP
jgi:hypothetical protein